MADRSASALRKVRIILGTDEEIGSLGVAHYLKTEGAPTMAFTPDAEYPVVNSEMGILQATVEIALKHPQLGEPFAAYLKEIVAGLA